MLRNDTGWRWVGIFLVLFHFVIPFFVLLSRDLKRRPGPLAFMAVWVLVVHYVDVYWVVMPRIDPQGPRPHWTDLTAFVGVGAAGARLHPLAHARQGPGAGPRPISRSPP